MIVLDTNVLSALMRPASNEPVIEWVDRQQASLLWTTSVSLMEIRTGLLLLPEGRRRQGLIEGLNALLDGVLRDRVLPFDVESAELASRVAATQHQRGVNNDVGDHQIAGIVMSRNATLATRNIKDFAELEISLVNPWQT
jgi:predicted nucleic acid-binding protein